MNIFMLLPNIYENDKVTKSGKIWKLVDDST